MTGETLKSRVNELLDLVGLNKARKRRLGTYSKGMLQRIGLAQALIHDPRLVVLDEPTAGVDPAGSREIRSEEHTSELQSLAYLVCRLLLEKKKNKKV